MVSIGWLFTWFPWRPWLVEAASVYRFARRGRDLFTGTRRHVNNSDHSARDLHAFANALFSSPARRPYARLTTPPRPAERRRRRTAETRKAPPARNWRGLTEWCIGLADDHTSVIRDYLMILVTLPEPTVRPPSRIAKPRPSSMAMGWISSTLISVLSPGMTISVPSGSVMTPVTSVVRK